jgi:hypothetical protein
MSRRQLLRDGVQADAEIIDIRYTNTANTHGPLFDVKLVVTGGDGRRFEIDGQLNASMVDPPTPGQLVPIRYDPQHPSRLVFDQRVADERREQLVDQRRRDALGDR